MPVPVLHHPDTVTGQPPAGTGRHPNRWLVLVAMTGALTMVLVDATVVSVALPSIQSDLGMDTVALQWVVNAYLLSLAVFVAIAGRIADLVGRLPVFLIGVVVFTVASALCGVSRFADSAEMLLIFRAIEGLGAAMMIPSSQAIVVDTFAVSERGRAMGIYAGISCAGLALGPLLGGVLTQTLGWDWVFWINLPIGAATIIVTLVARPTNTKVPSTGRFDVVGSLLLIASVGAIVYALMQANQWGWGATVTWVVLAAGAVGLVGFVLVERRVRAPVADVRVFTFGNFAVAAVVLFVVQFALQAISIYGAIYGQDILGFDPITAGLAMLPITLPLLILAVFAGKLYDRIGSRAPVAVGCLAMAVALAATGLLVPEQSYVLLIAGYVFTGVGAALVMTPANTDAMNSVPADLFGQAAGVLQALRQVGASLGVAVLTGIVVALTRSSLEDDLAAEGLDSAQIQRVEGILADLQGSGEAADKLPPGSPPELVEKVTAAAKDAFSGGLRVGYVVFALFMALAGVLALAFLRRLPRPSDGPRVSVG